MKLSILVLILILLPVLSGPALWLMDRRGRAGAAASVLTAAELLVCICLYPHIGKTLSLPRLFSLGLSFQVTGFQFVLCTLGCLLWFMTTAFCPYYFSGHGGVGRYQLFSFLTLGAIMGVFLSGDFVTLLIFFEIMSVTSWVMVIHEQTPAAIDAAASYLGFAVIGGLCTMMGLFLLHNLTGTLRFDELSAVIANIPHDSRLYTAGVFVLIGFATKAGMWPLHTWLPSAHPAAPATASALLSGIITKAGVFGVCAVSVSLFVNDYTWGMMILCFAVITMFTGAVLAIFSVDLKRTLACSSMSQIGFILVGVAMQRLLGEESAIAVYGTVLHVCNHSLLKLCLFLCAGVLVHCCHSRDLNALKGFGRGKPVFLLAFAMGTLGITCMPLFGGYVSKTLLHESIVEYIGILASTGQSVVFMKTVEVLFLASGGFTVAYMVKLFAALFVDKNDDQARMDSLNGRYLGIIPAAILLVAGITSPILGAFPHQTADKIAQLCAPFFASEGMEHAVHYFALANLKGAIISLAVGAVTYFGFIRTVLMKNGKYIDVWPEKLNLEKGIYRPLLLKVLPFICGFVSRLLGSAFDWLMSASGALLRRNNDKLGAQDKDDSFAMYPRDMQASRGAASTLAYGLALAALVIVSSFVYVLTRL